MCDFEYEIIVVDNESDDDSVGVALQMNCKVFTLKRSEFTYGRALNFGIELCEGEIILILSAHMILLNELFLQSIPSYFKNPSVAALRFVHAASIQQTTASLQNGTQILKYHDIPDFAINNWERLIVNHCAAIKKSCCQEVRFNEKVFASEDKLWSLDILKKGYSILYNVPCYYLYVKPFDLGTKTKRMIIEEAAKELITGKVQMANAGPYQRAFYANLTSGLKRLFSDIKFHRKVYKGINEYRNKYNDDFI